MSKFPLRKRPVGALLLLAALIWPLFAGAAVVERVRMHEAPTYTRVVFDTTGPTDFALFTLDNPFRVVIDLGSASLGKGFDPALAITGQGRVKALRAAPRAGGYRLVLDVSGVVDPRGFLLDPIAPYGHRLVVDLFSQTVPAKPAARPALPRNRDVVIAVDAGHGGEDPGSIGPNRTLEKDVALAISRKLVSRLNGRPGFQAFLVREGDYYIGLRERTQVARDARADLFVSIHADAFKSPKVSGASVYTLSARGATSETARWLAAKENQSDLIGGVGNVNLDAVDDSIRGIILEMSMDANMSNSIEAGEAVLTHLEAVTPLHKKTVEQARFMVLKSPDIPSMLVETGYISNPGEERKLRNPDYQARIAAAVAAGIESYLRRRPPPGTLLAAREDAAPRQHRISRGDTLSGIAARYGQSVDVIKRANRLAGDGIRVGQVLVIPSS